VKVEANNLINNASNLLIVGSSLATYSAFRLVKQAIENGKEVGLLNLGPTRADDLIEIESNQGLLWKTERGSGQVLPEVARILANESPSLLDWKEDPELHLLLAPRDNIPHRDGKVMAA